MDDAYIQLHLCLTGPDDPNVRAERLLKAFCRIHPELSIHMNIEDGTIIITHSNLLMMSMLFHFWTGGPGKAEGKLAAWVTVAPGVQLESLPRPIQIGFPPTGPDFTVEEGTPPDGSPTFNGVNILEEDQIESGPVAGSR
jgi:hypothetical protein